MFGVPKGMFFVAFSLIFFFTSSLQAESTFVTLTKKERAQTQEGPIKTMVGVGFLSVSVVSGCVALSASAMQQSNRSNGDYVTDGMSLVHFLSVAVCAISGLCGLKLTQQHIARSLWGT